MYGQLISLRLISHKHDMKDNQKYDKSKLLILLNLIPRQQEAHHPSATTRSHF